MTLRWLNAGFCGSGGLHARGSPLLFAKSQKMEGEPVVSRCLMPLSACGSAQLEMRLHVLGAQAEGGF